MVRKSTLYNFIAIFSDIRTMKFKPQPTVTFFAAVNHRKRTSQETEVHFKWVQRSRKSVVIGRLQYILLAVAIIMISWVMNFKVRMLLKGINSKRAFVFG